MAKWWQSRQHVGGSPLQGAQSGPVLRTSQGHQDWHEVPGERLAVHPRASRNSTTSQVSYCLDGLQVESSPAPRVSLALINGQIVSFEHCPPSHRFIIDPLSKWKMAWDLLLLLMISYQALLVPVELVFVERMTLAEPYNAIWCIEFAMGLLFLVDFVLSCLTAYVKADGTYVRNQREIVVHYALSPPFYMSIDLVSLVPFFLGFADLSGDADSASLSKAGKSGRFFRYVRLFRLLRLLRLARAARVIQSLSKVVILSGRYTLAIVGVLKLVIGYLLCVHLGACLWRVVSAFDVHAEGYSIDVSNAWHSYTFSVWWLVMTLADAAPTDPTAEWEMWVWSLFGSLAICVVTILTGVLVQILNSFNEEASELNEKLQVASQWISDHPVSEALKASVLGAVRSSFKHQRDTGRFQELVDPLLSEDLRRRLYGGIYGSMMRRFPPFSEELVQSRFLATLAIEAQRKVFGPNDIILHEGLAEDSMIFIVEGKAMLHSVTKRINLPLVAAHWFIGENALFYDPQGGQPPPLRLASLTAMARCEILAVERESFQQAVRDFGLSAWLEQHRRSGALRGWGCPACGAAGHWLDECEVLVMADQGGDLQGVSARTRPLREAAVQNFLASMNRKNHSMVSGSSALAARAAGATEPDRDDVLGRLLEEVRVARKEMAAAGDRLAALEKAAQEELAKRPPAPDSRGPGAVAMSDGEWWGSDNAIGPEVDEKRIDKL